MLKWATTHLVKHKLWHCTMFTKSWQNLDKFLIVIDRKFTLWPNSGVIVNENSNENNTDVCNLFFPNTFHCCQWRVVLNFWHKNVTIWKDETWHVPFWKIMYSRPKTKRVKKSFFVCLGEWKQIGLSFLGE